MGVHKIVPIGFKSAEGDRIKLALDAMPVAVSWTRLSDGRVEFANCSFVEMFGYAADDFPDVYGMIRAMFADAAQAETACREMADIIGGDLVKGFRLPPEEVRVRTKGGEMRTACFSGVVLPEADMSLATFVDITESKEREALLRRLAEEDPLTGMLNRRAFDLRVIEAVEKGAPFALVVFDLDGFKQVNDSLGHEAGDDILRQFATLLRSQMRESDICCRWGGDEFAMLIRPVPGEAGLDALVERLKAALANGVALPEGIASVGVSAGHALFPDEARGALDLWRLADLAMFKEKSSRQTASAEGPKRRFG